ncbi:MAG: T9SS type A sorting domain-containing protein [Lacibacter sp.]|jgi:hypothetical protein
MKLQILIANVALLWCTSAGAQVTGPVIKANFGVEADLRANFFNGFSSAGNDDWFRGASAGPGIGVIDTTGAAFIVNRYTTTPSSRSQPFFRGMRYPQFSIVNNRMLIDAIFIRDHHGDDSTVFASGSNKNGMSPQSWSTPVSQGIPDKNDILDMYMHVRRAGPNSNDSLWMFGGVSLDNTTGNRYFDFEMYQTDITYNRPTLSFTGYGPDAGHTSWLFDAGGNILKAGDVIFTAEYGSSSLSFIEARIWVHQSALSITPAAFNWGGSFDGGGPGATYGYASIVPKTAGDFYTGLQSANNTWAGPFQVVLQNNTVVANYTARQFMEFSVNLSKLGLDPLVTSNDPCAMPFRRVLVKSRASTSFTAELKDFVGPFSFFRAPAAELATDFPTLCLPGIATIWVSNPLVTSIYTWRALSGNIVSDTVGASIQVDQPGLYVVSQELMDSCGSVYVRDTMLIQLGSGCTILPSQINRFDVKQLQAYNHISWGTDVSATGETFYVERSEDGIRFERIAGFPSNASGDYSYTDPHKPNGPPLLFYRIKQVSANGRVTFSRIIRVADASNTEIIIGPNPVSRHLNIVLPNNHLPAEITVLNMNGVMVKQQVVQPQQKVVQFDVLPQWASGTYFVIVKQGLKTDRKKIIIHH